MKDSIINTQLAIFDVKNVYHIDYIDWGVILGKYSFFVSNEGSSFLAVILCLIKPFLASWPMTAVEASETRRMALSTACV